MNSQCPIPTCQVPIIPGHLLCRTHWRLVPPPIRDVVNHYSRRKSDSLSHRRACRQAITHVEQIVEQRHRTAQEGTDRDKAQRTKPPVSLPYRDD